MEVAEGVGSTEVVETVLIREKLVKAGIVDKRYLNQNKCG